jgi:L-ribulose-5-phosphate 4-epimerase
MQPHFHELKERSYRANMELVRAGLVVLTWGNASAIDREAGVLAIKPSGVGYDQLQPSDIVIVALESGEVVEGKMNPSSDTPTHLAIARAFPNVGGVIHTHSVAATGWAQARKEIPCFGTTHADHFYGPVPVTRDLTDKEIAKDYEANTGRVIVEAFTGKDAPDPDAVTAVLVPGHGPFAWGATVEKALENAIALEVVADMALRTRAIDPGASPLRQALLDRHYLRKHGPGATYGQKH